MERQSDEAERAKKKRLELFEKKKQSIDIDEFSQFLAERHTDILKFLKNDKKSIQWDKNLGMQNLREKEHRITVKYGHGSENASEAFYRYINGNQDLKELYHSLDRRARVDRAAYAVARLVRWYFEGDTHSDTAV